MAKHRYIDCDYATCVLRDRLPVHCETCGELREHDNHRISVSTPDEQEGTAAA